MGSGFLISQSGFVATSYHLFTDDNHRPFDKITAVLGKVGESFDCDQPLGDVVRLEQIVSTADVDAALLKIVSTKVYTPVSACLGPVVANGASLFVLGFPLGLPLASQSVTKSNETGKRWQITGKFDSGSSGGPVFSPDGMLVGLVFGGFDNTNISYVVPLSYFSNFFQTAGSQLRECASTQQPASNPRIAEQQRLICIEDRRTLLMRPQPFEVKARVTCDAEGRHHHDYAQYSAPLGYAISGLASHVDEKNEYGWVGPIVYSPDFGPHVTILTVRVECMIPDQSSRTKGVASTTVRGEIKKVLTNNDEARVRDECIPH